MKRYKGYKGARALLNIFMLVCLFSLSACSHYEPYHTSLRFTTSGESAEKVVVIGLKMAFEFNLDITPFRQDSAETSRKNFGAFIYDSWSLRMYHRKYRRSCIVSILSNTFKPTFWQFTLSRNCGLNEQQLDEMAESFINRIIHDGIIEDRNSIEFKKTK